MPNQAAPSNPHVNSLPHTQNKPGSTVAQRQPYVSRFPSAHIVAAVVNLWLRPFVCLLFFYVFYFRYKAVYNYKPQNADELELREGDVVQVMEKCDDGWFVGKKYRHLFY